MARVLTAEDLVQHKLITSPLTFSDGLSAVIVPESREFITSPNRVLIPRPPMGSTRDLYRREDGFYGEDDPVQHPQPLNSKYRYLACIPAIPRQENEPYWKDVCMWETRFHESQFPIGGDSSLMRDFASSVARLRSRQKELLASQGAWKSLLSELNITIDLCFHRLSLANISSRNRILAISELQQAWRTSTAAINYAQIFEPRMMTAEELRDVYEGEGSGESEMIGSRIGAFVWNDTDAMLLYRAKLPVYYIRPFNDFRQQRILDVRPFHETRVNCNIARPSYSTIYMGQAGSDAKFAAIRAASMTCFHTASPFENLHLPGAYQSSYSLGAGTIISPTASQPSSSKAPSSGPFRAGSTSAFASSKPYKHNKKVKAKQAGTGQQNDNQAGRDVFADLPTENPFVPPPIPAWRDSNCTIDTSHPDKRKMLPGNEPRLKTVVPDPNLIIGTTDQARQTSYLSQWARISQPFTHRIQAAGVDEVPTPLRGSVWRKALSVPFHGIYSGPSDPVNRQARDHEEATRWLETLFDAYAPGVEVAAPEEATVDHAEGRRLIHQLSLVNFWYQLMALDEIADSTVPVPAPGVSQSDHLIQRAAHRRHRLQLLDEVFGGYGDPFTAASLLHDVGIASVRWSDRFVALRAFWRMMDTWPGRKDALWRRGDDSNIAQMQAEGEQWERVLVRFYIQTYYNFLGFPPVQPRRV
ncbi:hypothetical protein V5O48_017374 [Marasmius crinis-equi]|uniref:Uncharacterized protein n=1 Tax=Marasmius crinis-equi TaxID=585013 RepID=A0ABR3EPC2_9AGAR